MLPDAPDAAADEDDPALDAVSDAAPLESVQAPISAARRMAVMATRRDGDGTKTSDRWGRWALRGRGAFIGRRRGGARRGRRRGRGRYPRGRWSGAWRT